MLTGLSQEKDYEMSKFKVGDKVVCVESSGWLENRIEEGYVYTVTKLKNNYPCVDNKDFSYSECVFELVNEDVEVGDILEMIGGLSRVNRERLFKKIKKGKWRTIDNSGVELDGNKNN